MRTLPSDARRPASVRGGLLGAILALALLAGGPAGARAEDESPDLQVELLRADGGPLPLSDGQQELQVRITNVSVWWATETALRVETVSPEAGNVLEIAVENLDPGQSVTYPYTLAAACAGHVVTAEVSAANNYAGVPETNVANNRVETQLCPPPAAEAAPPAAPAPAAEPAPAAPPAAPAPAADPLNPDDGTVDYGGVDSGALDRLRPIVAANLYQGSWNPYTTVAVTWQLLCETDGDARGPCSVQNLLVEQESPETSWGVAPGDWVTIAGTSIRIAGSYLHIVYDLQPNRTYRYRVCAGYSDGRVCSDYAGVTTQ